jgi:integrase
LEKVSDCIDSWPLTPDKLARVRCCAWQADIFAGREPGDKPASKVTFEDLLAEALPAMTRRLVLGSAKDFARSLKAACKHFGQKSVQLITVADVAGYLKPHWGRRSADKWRARIKRVFDVAIADGIIKLNPAMLAPIKSKLGDPNRETVNHLALPLERVPGLYMRLEAIDSDASRALRLIILTASRAAEIVRSEWKEFDTTSAVPLFTLPAKRCKSRREHVVPLTYPAVEILEQQRCHGVSVFKLADHACLFLLRELETDAPYTVHSFRACFSDCCDSAGVSSYITECCLNHVPPTRTMAAYKRSQQLDLRLDALWKWSCFVTGVDWREEVVKGSLAS